MRAVEPDREGLDVFFLLRTDRADAGAERVLQSEEDAVERDEQEHGAVEQGPLDELDDRLADRARGLEAEERAVHVLLLDARHRPLLLALQALQNLRPVHISFLWGGVGLL